jgi:hypothetical protein
VVPLVIIVFVSTLHRRMRYWRAIVAFIALGFVLALFVNPSYGFSFEDNLAYRDYIVLHQHAENFLEGHYAASRLLTAWPASDEVSRAYLGYITRPIQIVRIEDFSAEQLADAAKFRSNFDVALVFSTKYEPSHPWLGGWGQWQQWKREYFGYHRDLPPSAAANNLDGQLVYEEHRGGQWVGVIVLRREAATASQ